MIVICHTESDLVDSEAFPWSSKWLPVQPIIIGAPFRKQTTILLYDHGYQQGNSSRNYYRYEVYDHSPALRPLTHTPWNSHDLFFLRSIFDHDEVMYCLTGSCHASRKSTARPLDYAVDY